MPFRARSMRQIMLGVDVEAVEEFFHRLVECVGPRAGGRPACAVERSTAE